MEWNKCSKSQNNDSFLELIALRLLEYQLWSSYGWTRAFSNSRYYHPSLKMTLKMLSISEFFVVKLKKLFKITHRETHLKHKSDNFQDSIVGCAPQAYNFIEFKLVSNFWNRCLIWNRMHFKKFYNCSCYATVTQVNKFYFQENINHMVKEPTTSLSIKACCIVCFWYFVCLNKTISRRIRPSILSQPKSLMILTNLEKCFRISRWREYRSNKIVSCIAPSVLMLHT